MRRSPGFAYLFAMLVTALLAGAVLVTVEESSLELAMARNRVDAVRSEWLARGAIHQVAWRMRYEPTFRTAVSQGPIPKVIQDPLLGGGAYDYDISRNGFNWLITGTGGAGGAGFVTHQLVPDSILARQIACPCIADAFISEIAPAQNYGASGNLSLKVLPGSRQRILLQFSFTNVPLLTSVQSAYLEVWLGSAVGDETVDLEVHDLAVAWIEGTRQGSGLADGANWTNRSTTKTWNNPGAEGDYGSSSRGGGPVSTTPGIYRWDITGLVREWVGGSRVNNGLLIRAQHETENSPAQEGRSFFSREDPSGRGPAIYITY